MTPCSCTEFSQDIARFSSFRPFAFCVFMFVLREVYFSYYFLLPARHAVDIRESNVGLFLL